MDYPVELMSGSRRNAPFASTDECGATCRSRLSVVLLSSSPFVSFAVVGGAVTVIAVAVGTPTGSSSSLASLEAILTVAVAIGDGVGDGGSFDEEGGGSFDEDGGWGDNEHGGGAGGKKAGFGGRPSTVWVAARFCRIDPHGVSLIGMTQQKRFSLSKGY